MNRCRIPGCPSPVTRWGAYCSTHKSRLRRHGHPAQEAVTKADLGPYLDRVRERKCRNPDNPLWKLLEGRWAALIEHCRSTLAIGEKVPMNRHERRACREMADLVGQLQAAEVVETALALFLMLRAEPKRFLSDDAFRHQLTRRIRSLADLNVGTWYDHSTGKAKRVYRDLPARTTVTMGALLERTFGPAGLMLAEKESEEAARQADEARLIAEAIKVMG